MPLNRIPITPNMDPAAMAQAMNQNLEQIESENRTKVIKDADGVNRIIMGQLPNGDYGLVVSNVGVDVLSLVGG